MEPRTLAELLSQLRQRAPFADDAASEQALFAVLKSWSSRLMPEERAALARALPAECAQILREVGVSPRGDAAAVDALAQTERVSRATALEHLEVVASVLGEDSEARRILSRAFPELERHLAGSGHEAGELPDYPPLERANRQLSGGRPGSAHPLADAAPDRAQRHSVVSAQEPHADTKLSAAHGLTQEREGTTLADGRPGSLHPVSGAGDRRSS